MLRPWAGSIHRLLGQKTFPSCDKWNVENGLTVSELAQVGRASNRGRTKGISELKLSKHNYGLDFEKSVSHILSLMAHAGIGTFHKPLLLNPVMESGSSCQLSKDFQWRTEILFTLLFSVPDCIAEKKGVIVADEGRLFSGAVNSAIGRKP